MNKITLEIHPVDVQTSLSLPFADGGIRAGFPNVAQDYLERAIDLNKELVKHPASTFYGRVKGDSMKDANIDDGDILIIDKSLEPQDGDMAVCYIDGEFTLKYIEIKKDIVWLVPANDKYKPIKVTTENEFIVWGIVIFCIKDIKRRKRNG